MKRDRDMDDVKEELEKILRKGGYNKVSIRKDSLGTRLAGLMATAIATLIALLIASGLLLLLVYVWSVLLAL